MSVTREQIARINELAQLARERELTSAESAERDTLRKAYIASVRENMRAQLENIELVDDEDEKS